MCERGCIYLSTMSRGAPPMASKSEYICEEYTHIENLKKKRIVHRKL